jgi:predicted nucleic acid-binding protein
MSLYADSSFLVSCYLADANSSQARNYLLGTSLSLSFTPLHKLEVGNAFELGVFRGLFSAADSNAAQANLDHDLRSGRLARVKVNWLLAFRVASFLSRRHSASKGTRSIDTLHVAVAKSLRVTEFLSFDGRQRALAVALGLKVGP